MTPLEQRIHRYAFWVAWTLTISFGLAFALATLGFWLGIPLSGAVSNLAVLVTGAALAKATKGSIRAGLASSAGYLLVTAFLFWSMLPIANRCVDASGDGRWFHQEAVIQLAAGWNPVYSQPDLHPDSTESIRRQLTPIWVRSYPKSGWIISALIYQATGNLEMGKAMHFLLACAATLLLLACFADFGLALFPAAALAFSAVWTPIVIDQLYSFYLDGDVYCLILLLLAFGWHFLRDQRWYTGAAVALSAVFLINLKFLGLVYALAALGGLGLWALIAHRPSFVRFAALASASAFLGILWFGYNPYVRNTLEAGHPFYPAFGAKRLVGYDPGPRNFGDLNRFEDLFYTVFSTPEVFSVRTGTVRPKPLFRVTTEDLIQFKHWPDVAVNGYGVLFAESLIVSIPLLLLTLWRPRRRDRLLIGFGVIALILAATLVKDLAWYARYNPQISLIPIVLVIMALQEAAYGGWRGFSLRALSLAVCAILLLNTAFVAYAYFLGQIELTQNYQRNVTQAVDASRKGAIPVWFEAVRGWRVFWRDNGVRFFEVKRQEDLPCAKPISPPMEQTLWCPPDAPSK